MRRYAALAFGLTLSACTADPAQTTEIEQGATTCTIGGDFKEAKMIAQPWWNGSQPPQPGTNAGYVLWMDAQASYWNALLADPSTGKIDYAVKLTPQQIGGFLAAVGPYGRIDVGHVPPLPDPTGGDWNARFALKFVYGLPAYHQEALFESQ
jgi:hypothetical protein